MIVKFKKKVNVGAYLEAGGLKTGCEIIRKYKIGDEVDLLDCYGEGLVKREWVKEIKDANKN